MPLQEQLRNARGPRRRPEGMVVVQAGHSRKPGSQQMRLCKCLPHSLFPGWSPPCQLFHSQNGTVCPDENAFSPVQLFTPGPATQTETKIFFVLVFVFADIRHNMDLVHLRNNLTDTGFRDTEFACDARNALECQKSILAEIIANIVRETAARCVGAIVE